MIVVCAALLTWFSYGFSRSFADAQDQPERAIAAWRTAPALASAAAVLAVQAPSAANMARAERLATETLLREPSNVVAMRTLALAQDLKGQHKRAGVLMGYAERMSRRDVPTQLWLIQEAVTAGKIPDALHHYDRALSTSWSMRDVLLPILIEAAAEPEIADRLSRRLAERPNWWMPAVTRFVTESNDPSSLALVLRRMKLNPADDYERSLLGPGIARLVRNGAYGDAQQIYLAARPEMRRATTVRDGDFSSDPLLPPFDWELGSSPDLSANRVAGDGSSDLRLELVAADAHNGTAAKQLLLLAPGRYRLTALVGNVGQGSVRPAIELRCAEGAERPIATMPFPATGAGAVKLGGAFIVPEGGCRAQWLNLQAVAPIEETSVGEPWIDKIEIRPEAAARP